MPAVMIYVQHLLGIGHLMRARVIAEALADAGFAVHLVSGGTAIGGRMPRNVHVVQLPPIRVSDASFNPLRDAAFTPIDEAYREARRAELLAAYDAARPDAVLFETFPFGRRQLRFELVPLLERIDATRPRPLVVSSVREILQAQPKPEREREMQEWAARWFDAVLVHGDPRFARFEETYPLAGGLAPPVHYTGFVLTPGPPDAGAAPAPRDEVVVSAGGGGVGIQHLANALAAQRLSRHGHLTWRVLAGPNITDEGYRRLMAEAAPTAIVERSRADFQALLRRAFVSVSQGGYNTVLDVLSSGARPVIVPFTGNGETEQRERGERLARLCVAVVLDDRSLTPQGLADAVDDAATRSFARFDFDCGGAAGTAAFFLRALAGRRPAGRAGAT
jgi:predicted glycosyltransferase